MRKEFKCKSCSIAQQSEANLKFSDRAYKLYVRERNFKSNKAMRSETSDKKGVNV
ncbi:hypothetical protein [Campylobacter mucosalis]|uniref:Uncharacterized protein n=1 Tax=Campylobacter mucosalis CCUG 21559 TaxID=1032067 RepID=A0A6G5QFV8_9BACT|nr:hypothetical protein [Campylobacter mucosalis]QCD44457.1 hypothetical protein CMUC_0658 [Campylobacter mucosalis CCUG 21559]